MTNKQVSKKHHDKNNLREKGFILAHRFRGIGSIATGRHSSRNVRLVGHIVPTVRKQREDRKSGESIDS